MHACMLSRVCDSMDCTLPGFSVNEIFQARILEWVSFASPALAGEFFTTAPLGSYVMCILLQFLENVYC